MSVKIQLNVIPPHRPPVVVPPGTPSLLSEPMRRFRCNQKGCCCSGWDIPFRLEDFVRLAEHLDDKDREEMSRGVQLVLESPTEGDPQQQQILHSLKLAGVGDDKACRFLEPAGGCGVHARHGLAALPDLCVDFPAFSYLQEDHVELWFDPVCPEVLNQLDESEAPLELYTQEGAFGDDGFDLRVAHTADKLGARIGGDRLEQSDLEGIRNASVLALAEPRPVWKSLAALLHAYRRLRIGNEAAFEAVEPEDPQPFLRFLFSCVGAHGASILAGSLGRYRRFIYAIDPAPLFARMPELLAHLEAWEPALEKWVAPHEDAIRPLAARWLAHRFGTPMIKGRGELRNAADDIAQLYGTSLRYAAAIAATLEVPVDRALYKVAIGAAEFFFRSLNLPREALPSFAAPARNA